MTESKKMACGKAIVTILAVAAACTAQRLGKQEAAANPASSN